MIDGNLQRNGHGIHTTPDGHRYEGQWAADRMLGKGYSITIFQKDKWIHVTLSVILYTTHMNYRHN